MPITDELVRLGTSSQRLHDGSERLDQLIVQIDDTLAQLMFGFDYVHPTPVSETTTHDAAGKRIIEIAFVGYLEIQGRHCLAIKTVKVLESKSQLASEQPGAVVSLMAAPRRLRYAAVDVLPELVTGLAMAVDEVVHSIEDRCATAEVLLRHLQEVADGDVRGDEVMDEEIGHREATRPFLHHPHHGVLPGADVP